MSKLKQTIELDIEGFRRNAEKVKGDLKGMSNTAVKEGQKVDEFSNKLKAGIAGALSVAAVTAFIRNVAVIRGEFESLGIAIETFLGSKERADKLMAQISKTAAITPFTMQEVSQGAQQLLAFGVEAENVDSTLRQLGNVASGVNKSLGDIIGPFGRIMSTGVVMSRDLLTMASQGVPVYAELAKVIGTTSEEIGKMATNGQITREHIVTMYEAMSAEGGKFYKLMEKQAVGTKGLMANFGVAIESMQNDIGESLQPAINKALKGGINLAENYKEVATVIGDLIVVFGTYKAALIVVTALQNNVYKTSTLMARAFIIARNAMKSFNATLAKNPIGLIAMLITSVVYALYKLSTAEKSADKATRLFNESQDKALELTEERKAKVDSLINSIQDETLANLDRSGSLDKLISLYPEIIQKYIDEEGKLKNILALKKEIAEFEVVQQKKEQSNRIKELDSQIARLEEDAKTQGGSQTGLGFIESQLRQAYAERGLIEAKIEKEQADEAMKNWQVSLKKLTAAQIDEERYALNARYEKSTEEERKLIQTKLNVLGAELTSRSQGAKPLNYSYWEDVKKNAEDALKSMGVGDVGTKEWMELTQQILQASEELEKYSIKEREGAVLTSKEIDLKRRVEAAKLELTKIGVTDRLALLEIERKEELYVLEQELKDKKYLIEDYNELLILLNEKYNARRELIEKEDSEALRKELSGRLESFKNDEAMLVEIKERYAKLRLAASKDESYDIVKINKAEADEIEAIQGSLVDKMMSLFGDVSKYSVEHLKSLKENFRDMMESVTDADPTKLKALKEAFENIENAIIDKDPFKELLPAIEKYKKGQEELNKLKEEYNKLTPKEKVEEAEALASAIRSQAEAQDRLNKSINAVGSKGSEMVEAGYAFMKMLGSMGYSGKSKNVDSILGGLGDVFGSLERIDITKPLSIIRSVFGVLGGVAKTLGGLGKSIIKVFRMGKRARRENEKNLEILRKQNVELNRQYAIKQAIAKVSRADTVFGTDEWSKSKALAEQYKLERDELRKSYSKISDAEVVTGSHVSRSFWRSKAKKDWSGLLDAYPDLIKANGEFNISLAESILATKELDKNGRQALEELTEQAKSVESAFSALKDSLSGVFGSLGMDITDSLISAYRTGEDATDMFVNNISKSMDELAKNMIAGVIFKDILEDYQDAIVDLRLDGGLTDAEMMTETSKLMGGLAKELAGAESEMFALIEAYEKAMREQGLRGFETEQEVGKVIGQYQTLSEDTGKLLEGRANVAVTYLGLIKDDLKTLKTGNDVLVRLMEVNANGVSEMRDMVLNSSLTLVRIAKGTDNLYDIKKDINDMKVILRDKL